MSEAGTSQFDGVRGSAEGSTRNLARPDGFEPPTTWFEAKCSIQLSYGREVREVYPHFIVGMTNCAFSLRDVGQREVTVLSRV